MKMVKSSFQCNCECCQKWKKDYDNHMRLVVGLRNVKESEGSEMTGWCEWTHEGKSCGLHAVEGTGVCKKHNLLKQKCSMDHCKASSVPTKFGTLIYCEFHNELLDGVHYCQRCGVRRSAMGKDFRDGVCSVCIGDDYVQKVLRDESDKKIALDDTKKNALDVQIAGNHYKNFVIQPVEFCQKNKLGFCESSVIKYISRHKNKNGKEDLKKAKHFIDLLLDLEYSQ